MAKGSELGGCLNCYAARMAARNLPEMRSPTTGKPFAILTKSGPRWTGKVELIESKLDEPLHWKKPRRVFVNSMSDLFHEALPNVAIDRVFAVMALSPKHTFQILTKRPERMLDYLANRQPGVAGIQTRWGYWASAAIHRLRGGSAEDAASEARDRDPGGFPLLNVWLGVSIENQATADARIPLLRETPSAVRFLSIEPLLEDIGELDLRGISWVIVGGESGPDARPMHPDWARSVRDQCQAAGTAFFFKQWGEYHPLTRTDGIHESGQYTMRVGKKAAGRLLDGREWNEFPQPASAEACR